MSDSITKETVMGVSFKGLLPTKPIVIAVKRGISEYKQGVAGDLTCDTMVIARVNNGGVFITMHTVDDYFTVPQQKAILRQYIETKYPETPMEFLCCQ